MLYLGAYQQQEVSLAKKQRCVLCNHPVGGGNRHAKGSCPPKRVRRARQSFLEQPSTMATEEAARGVELSGAVRRDPSMDFEPAAAYVRKYPPQRTEPPTPPGSGRWSGLPFPGYRL